MFDLTPELGVDFGLSDSDESYQLGAAMALLLGAYSHTPDRTIGASARVDAEGRVVGLGERSAGPSGDAYDGSLIERKCRLILDELPELKQFFVATVDRPYAIRAFEQLGAEAGGVDVIGIDRLEEVARYLNIKSGDFVCPVRKRTSLLMGGIAAMIVTLGFGSPMAFDQRHTDRELRVLLFDVAISEVLTLLAFLLIALAVPLKNYTQLDVAAILPLLFALTLPELVHRIMSKVESNEVSSRRTNTKHDRFLFGIYQKCHIYYMATFGIAYFLVLSSHVTKSSYVSGEGIRARAATAVGFLVFVGLAQTLGNAFVGVACVAAAKVAALSGSPPTSKTHWLQQLCDQFGVAVSWREAESVVRRRFWRTCTNLPNDDSYTAWEQYPLSRMFWRPSLLNLIGFMMLSRIPFHVIVSGFEFGQLEAPPHAQPKISRQLSGPGLQGTRVETHQIITTSALIDKWQAGMNYVVGATNWLIGFCFLAILFNDLTLHILLLCGALTFRLLAFRFSLDLAYWHTFLFFWSRRLTWILGGGLLTLISLQGWPENSLPITVVQACLLALAFIAVVVPNFLRHLSIAMRLL